MPDSIETVPQKSTNPVAASLPQLDEAIDRAEKALIALQHPDGSWCFELEADCTIPAEYIMMMHFRDEIDEALQAKIAVYLRDHQLDNGGWPLYLNGEADISCSVKAYYALKLAGDSTDAPHMVKAREHILSVGGAATSNVFTRIALALFEQVPWRAVPFIPVEIMILPKWFFFHLSKVSYWSRTVMVPLFILCTYKPKAKNPNKVSVEELFTVPPDKERNYFPVRSPMNLFFLMLDKMGRCIEPLIPGKLRRHATKKAENWFIERLNGLDGLGAIFPAMVNALEALELLGYPSDHEFCKTAKEAIDRLVVEKEDSAYCQPCVSPVWDTGLASLALLESGSQEAQDSAYQAMEWLEPRQLLEEKGDWSEYRPNLRGGGWPFQYGNDHYPDLDDTAVVAYAMLKVDPERFKEPAERAAEWIAGMQSRNGGFAAFDADNTYYHLNEIPFADHGALLDPPTSDVSARCVMFFSKLRETGTAYEKETDSCLTYLSQEQEYDGAWFGRWGTNYIYGTWSVLLALEEAGVPPEDPRMRAAVEWLISVQRGDGGWGESNDTYEFEETRGRADRSAAFQTAWAVLALMAAGEANSVSVRRGIEFILREQVEEGLWADPEFTAPGFPRVFYLKYHGYDKFFPLWALARYRNLISAQNP